MPTISRMPALLRFDVICSIGPAKVSAAVLGPRLLTMSVSVFVVSSGSPTRPTIETIAISAGNSESRPKYVRAAAQIVMLSSLNSVSVRLSVANVELLAASPLGA